MATVAKVPAAQNTCIIVVVGAHPSSLAHHRKNPLIKFIHQADDFATEDLSQTTKCVIVSDQIGVYSARRIAQAVKAAAPDADIVTVSRNQNFNDAINDALGMIGERSLSKAVVVEYKPVQSTALPKGTTIDADGVLSIPAGRVKLLEDQPRKTFRKIEDLARSVTLSGGNHTPGLVRRYEGDPDYDWQLVDGERRLKACILTDTPFRALTKKIANSEEHYDAAVMSNSGREKHQAMEIARIIERMSKRRSFNEIAGILCESYQFVFGHAKLLRLEPSVQKLVLDDDEEATERGIRYSVAKFIAELPKDMQLPAARHIIEHHLSYFSALTYLRKIGKKRGVIVGDVGRTHRRDLQNLKSFLRRSVSRMTVFTQIVDDSAAEIFGKCASSDRRELGKLIVQLTVPLAKIQKKLSAFD